MIDFQQIIIDLNGKGYRYGKISSAVGAKYKHIGDLARGDVVSPRFHTGLKLIKLYNKVCPEKEISL